MLKLCKVRLRKGFSSKVVSHHSNCSSWTNMSTSLLRERSSENSSILGFRLKACASAMFDAAMTNSCQLFTGTSTDSASCLIYSRSIVFSLVMAIRCSKSTQSSEILITTQRTKFVKEHEGSDLRLLSKLSSIS